MNRLSQAVVEWTEILKKDPQRIDAYLSRAALNKELGNPDKAEGDYDMVFEKSSKNVQLLQSLAWILATAKEKSQRDGVQALKFARQADK